MRCGLAVQFCAESCCQLPPQEAGIYRILVNFFRGNPIIQWLFHGIQ
jgi:hypothetical protein